MKTGMVSTRGRKKGYTTIELVILSVFSGIGILILILVVTGVITGWVS